MKRLNHIIFLLVLSSSVSICLGQKKAYKLLPKIDLIDDQLNSWVRPYYEDTISITEQKKEIELQLDTIVVLTKDLQTSIRMATLKRTSKKDYYLLEKYCQTTFNIVEFYRRDILDHKYAIESATLFSLKETYAELKAVIERKYRKKYNQ